MRRPAWWAALLAIGLTCAGCLTQKLGGAFSRQPQDAASLSQPAQRLVAAAFADLPGRPIDHHVHIVGLGTGGTGIWVNPTLRTWRHPIERFKFNIYLSAAAVADETRADRLYVERLVELARHMPVTPLHLILAFDKRYKPDGTVDLEHTQLYVPNDYVFALSTEFPDIFTPVISVHPYRPDAIAELTRGAKAGARMVKWLPNTMGIDPADPRCDAFYDAMHTLGLALLSHAGREQAVDSADQDLGNPLRLRRALDHGVVVIAAHAASLGDDLDLDDPQGGSLSAFALLMRMFEEPRYQGLLFADISAMTQINRIGLPLSTLLARTDLHSRLINGSDYPLPAINVLFSTSDLVDDSYLTEDERAALNEVYDVNPLLFDFVLKRTIHDPQGTGRFSPTIFTQSPVITLK